MRDDEAPMIFKPTAVTQAVITVWVWIVFLALSGLYQARIAVPQVNDMLVMLSTTIDAGTLYWSVAGTYFVGALTMVGVAINLNAGKHAARTALLWAFIIDFIVTVFSFEHTLADYILTPIDIGLQSYALWLVYTKPGSGWFATKA